MFIVLIGYMGAGKTSVGRELAAKLSVPFIDLDQIIEANDDRSISEIFQQKGEAYFRRLESLYLESTLQLPRGVLATGGGTPIFENNLEKIKNHSTSIYLRCSAPLIIARLNSQIDQRPLIKGLEEDELADFVIQHLSHRSPYYEQADITIECDGKSIDDITDEIVKRLS